MEVNMRYFKGTVLTFKEICLEKCLVFTVKLPRNLLWTKKLAPSSHMSNIPLGTAMLVKPPPLSRHIWINNNWRMEIFGRDIHSSRWMTPGDFCEVQPWLCGLEWNVLMTGLNWCHPLTLFSLLQHYSWGTFSLYLLVGDQSLAWPAYLMFWCWSMLDFSSRVDRTAYRYLQEIGRNDVRPGFGSILSTKTLNTTSSSDFLSSYL